MEREYDIAVVGAGPAGAACGRRAAELGLSVLVLEKASFPRSKPCGAAVSARGLALVGGAVDGIAHDRIYSTSIEFGPAIRLVWRGTRLLLATTTRKELDSFLVERAVEAGARVAFGRRVVSVEDGDGIVHVGTRGETCHARYVVAADGVRSDVGRLVGVRPPRLGGAIYVRVRPDSDRDLERFRGAVTFDASAQRRGYGWIFPKRDHLNVGIFSQSPLGRGLTDALEGFLDARGFSSWRSEGPFASPIPVAVRTDALVSGRVLFAGDAAGLVDPISGEGISHAIASGLAAAEAVAESLRTGGDACELYQRAVVSEIVPLVNVLRRIGNTVYSMGPRVVGGLLRFPPVGLAISKRRSWRTMGADEGRPVVESPSGDRHQQR